VSYDKVKSDGTRIVAPKFTSRVLDSVPIVFQLFEWLLVIVAFQYADVRFHFSAAKVIWLGLLAGFALYFGVLVSNTLWRIVEDPFKSRPWSIITRYIVPILTGVVIFGLGQVVKQMVVAHS
jgi:hypothetical protein